MEISSPPATKTEKVRYIAVGFTSGEGRQFTLYEEDTYKELTHEIRIVTATPPEKVTIYKAALAWSSIIETTIIREVEETADERRARVAVSGEGGGSGSVGGEAESDQRLDASETGQPVQVDES